MPGRAASYRESARVAPGSSPAVIDTPAGRLGLSVCYDVRFPELYRHLTAAGAQLLAVPSAFTSPTGRAHWETLVRAREIGRASCRERVWSWGVGTSGKKKSWARVRVR